MGNSLEFGEPVRPHSDYNGTPPDLWPALAMREVVRNPRIPDTALLSRENQPPPSRSAFCGKRAFTAGPSHAPREASHQVWAELAGSVVRSLLGTVKVAGGLPDPALQLVQGLAEAACSSASVVDWGAWCPRVTHALDLDYYGVHCFSHSFYECYCIVGLYGIQGPQSPNLSVRRIGICFVNNFVSSVDD